MLIESAHLWKRISSDETKQFKRASKRVILNKIDKDIQYRASINKISQDERRQTV